MCTESLMLFVNLNLKVILLTYADLQLIILSLSFRRHTGAFTPKNANPKQLLTDMNGYRLRDTDDRLSREKKEPAKEPTSKRPPPKSRQPKPDKPADPQIGPPINHNGNSKYF